MTESPSYIPLKETESVSARQGYWDMAKGLQQVDGLKPTPYLEQLEAEHVEGKRSIAETGEEIRAYYKQQQAAGANAALGFDMEADLVSQRIVERLSSGAFLLEPQILSDIHRALFQDLDARMYRPGEYKTAALQKQEAILNGDSVVYADPSLIERSLALAFGDERDHAYSPDFDQAQLEHLARFISRIWQVHPFQEGNTRTIAVFAILYLRDLGFDVSSAPFKEQARYFRDALVRANYRNAKARTMPDFSFLVRFFDDLLNDAGHELDPEGLKVAALFSDPDLLRNVPTALAFKRTGDA